MQPDLTQNSAVTTPAAEALRESEGKYRHLFENLNDAALLADAETGIILDANRQAETLFGRPRDEIIGIHQTELHPPGKGDEYRRRFGAHVTGGHTADYDGEIVGKDGTVVPTSIAASPLTLGGQRLVLGLFRDITERKRAEETLRESRARLLKAQRVAQMGFLDWNLKTNEMYWSDEVFSIFGIDPKTKPTRELTMQLVHPDDLEFVEKNLDLAVSGLRPYDIDHRNLRPDGMVICVHSQAQLVRDAAGNPQSLLGTVVDITGRKQFEAALAESEERYRALFEQAADSIVLVDPRTASFIDFNDRAHENLGYTREEFARLRIADLETTETHDDVLRHAASVLTGGGETFETKMRTKKGDVRDVLVRTKAISIGGGTFISSIWRDITERKRAEAALRRSEDKHRSIVETTYDWVWEIDRRGQHTYSNRSIETILGYRPEELVRLDTFELIHEEDQAVVAEQLPRFAAQKRGWTHWVIRWRHKDGTYRFLESNAVPILNADGELIGFRGTDRDITERKRAEEALKRSEREKAAVLDSMSALVAYQSPDMRVRWANRAAGESVGMSPDQLVGRHCYEVWHGRQEPCTDCPVAKTLQTDRCHEKEMATPNGRIRHVRSYPVRDASGSIEGVVEVAQDITERKRAEEALRDSEDLLRRVIDADPNSIFVKDKTGRYMLANEAHARLYGTTPDEMVGKTDADFARKGAPLAREADDFVTDDLNVIESRQAKLIPEEPFTLSDGATRWFQTTKVPLTLGGSTECVLGVAVDITDRKWAEQERRELEAQVQHAQKLESLGVLAGGIAHDFNNLLAGMLGNADLALLDLPETSAARTSLEEIKAASARASHLTRQMLAYSGRGQFVVKALDLNEVVSEVAHLLHASISKKATITFDLAEELGAIEADAAQIQQVVMNLITNASDAIGERAGVIAIRTQMVAADRALLSQGLGGEELPEGRYVMLEVTDTGRGMDGETRAKVFDPFFTTKFAGRGLGLAAVLGIVRGHRGTIMVGSEPGAGTTFTILFPCSARPAEALEPELPAAAWHGTGTILVVDDELLVSGVATRILEHAGFTVLTASRASEGVEMFRTHADQIVAVLLDMTMPEMSGAEVYHELRQINPDVPVILTSGYNQQDAVGHFADEELAGFVAKPFEIDTLISAVRQVLGG